MSAAIRNACASMGGLREGLLYAMIVDPRNRGLRGHLQEKLMYRTLLAVVACALLTAQAWSQGPQPVQGGQAPQIETKKVEGTDNVYTFRNQNSQAIFIVT